VSSEGDPGQSGESSAASGQPSPAPREPSPAPRESRPMMERLGLASIALVLGLLFGGVAAASWVGGEPFLAVMGGIGCLMTIWVGVLTLLRG
jgi:hypothetical protein